MYLTDHFKLIEFTRSQMAARLGIDNKPSQEIVDNLTRVAEKMEVVRSTFKRPILITSGYRCLALNRALGSKDTSAHVKGLACDFEIPGENNIDVFEKLREKLTYDQLIGEFLKVDDPEAGWIHLGLSDGEFRNQAFFIPKRV